MIVRSPSAGRAQFFARAARSTTSSRSAFGRSVNVDAEDVVVGQQLLGHDIVLPRRSGELELEDTIFRVIENTLAHDADAARAQDRLELGGRIADACPNG